MRHFGKLMVLILAVFMTGCGASDSNRLDGKEAQRLEQEEGIPSLITLSCNQNLDSRPCRDVAFDRSDEIRIVTEAIFKAERMQGILDYAAEYTMSITNADGSVTVYDLSLGSDPKMQGLLVNQKDTTIGYTIPLVEANRLRQIIQRRID